MKKEDLDLIVNIQVGADMAKDWLNKKSINKDERIWKDLDSILESAEELMKRMWK